MTNHSSCAPATCSARSISEPVSAARMAAVKVNTVGVSPAPPSDGGACGGWGAASKHTLVRRSHLVHTASSAQGAAAAGEQTM